MASNASTPPSRDPIDQIRTDVIKAMAVRAALQLDIFSPLAKGPKTAAELAQAIGVKPRRLEMLLYQLVASDFLELDGERFANTPMTSHYFVKGKQNYYGGIHGSWTEQFNAMMCSAESIIADEPKAKIDFAGMTPQQLGTFLRGLHGMALVAGRAIAKSPEFAEAKRIVDVGCGSGGLAIAVCEEHPHIHATIIDFPSVIHIAMEMVGEAGLSDRITGQTTDVLEKPLTGDFDIVVARALFQVLSADQCELAARHIAAALPTGGSLFVVGFIADDSRLSPEVAVGMNTSFLNIFQDGQTYTETQYRTWLGDAGFTDIVRTPSSAGNSLITARKA